MKPQIDPKLKSVIESLKAQGFILKGITNGFRVKLDNGHDVDVYTLKSNPDQIRARLKIAESNPDNRRQQIEAVYSEIERGVRGVAAIYPFKLTKDMKNVFVYYAHIDISDTPVFHETVEMPDQGGGEDREAEEAANQEEGEATLQMEVEQEIEAVDAADEPDAIEITEVYVAEAESQAEMVDLIDYTDFIEPAAISVEEAVNQLDAVDAKMLRQALDSLSLPRSSNVRLVLTRLFRSAVDPEELEASIAIEAEKINKSNDLEELNMIRERETADFLTPLIALLWKEIGGDNR